MSRVLFALNASWLSPPTSDDARFSLLATDSQLAFKAKETSGVYNLR